MYYHKDPDYFNKIFLPYEILSNIIKIRYSICKKVVVAVHTNNGRFAITIPDEFYSDGYTTEQEAMNALDAILVRHGCKLLSSVDDADKYRILL